MINSFDHVHLYARDLAVALRFYTHDLGAENIGILPSNSGSDNHLLLLGGQFLVVSRFPEGMEPATPPPEGDGALTHGFGVAHFGLNVADLAQTIATLQSSGVRVHSSPRGAGAVRFVYFTAPDGVVIELTEYKLPPKLRPLAKVAVGIDRGIHRVRRLLGQQLVRGAG
jgi:catechol 2,3-dioxygenase-like lactoylglutathione lyase family enzyme